MLPPARHAAVTVGASLSGINIAGTYGSHAGGGHHGSHPNLLHYLRISIFAARTDTPFRLEHASRRHDVNPKPFLLRVSE
jgi:hypothetical protein